MKIEEFKQEEIAPLLEDAVGSSPFETSGSSTRLKNGSFQSTNYVKDTKGWALSADGDLDDNSRPTQIGTTTFSGTTTTTITIGYKVKEVLIFTAGGTNDNISSSGGWTRLNGNKCVHYDNVAAANVTETTAWFCGGAGTNHQGTVTNVTGTSFDLANTKNGAPANIALIYIARG